MFVMILVRNLPHVSIKIYEFFCAGYTHNWKARTGLTSPSLVLNYYLLNDSIQFVILSSSNEADIPTCVTITSTVIFLPLLIALPSWILSLFFVLDSDIIKDHEWAEPHSQEYNFYFYAVLLGVYFVIKSSILTLIQDAIITRCLPVSCIKCIKAAYDCLLGAAPNCFSWIYSLCYRNTKNKKLE